MVFRHLLNAAAFHYTPASRVFDPVMIPQSGSQAARALSLSSVADPMENADKPDMEQASPPNGMSIDLEDYFHAHALGAHVPRSTWDRLDWRVERSTDRVLELLADWDTRATFFVLGMVAERYPSLVRRVAEAGHEIASHGWAHERVDELDRVGFRRDVSKTRERLEELTGTPVVGYRAPSFSIGRDSLWALEVLAEVGYRYDSSIVPVRHDHYGMAEASRFCHPIADGRLMEIPVTTRRVAGRNIPCGGGGWFRAYPYGLSRRLLSSVNLLEAERTVFYCHPWEFDPAQPRVRGLPLKTRFRHYVGLERMSHRFSSLLQDFRWDRIDRVFASELAAVS